VEPVPVSLHTRDSPEAGSHRRRPLRTGDTCRASPTIHAHTLRNTGDEVCARGDDAHGSDDSRTGDGQSNRCARTAGTYRGVREEFSRKRGNGALSENRGLGTK
jgi:hypothetical protein